MTSIHRSSIHTALGPVNSTHSIYNVFYRPCEAFNINCRKPNAHGLRPFTMGLANFDRARKSGRNLYRTNGINDSKVATRASNMNPGLAMVEETFSRSQSGLTAAGLKGEKMPMPVRARPTIGPSQNRFLYWVKL